MANAGLPNSGDGQWYITFVPTPHLDDADTVFGKVVAGMEVVNDNHGPRSIHRDIAGRRNLFDHNSREQVALTGSRRFYIRSFRRRLESQIAMSSTQYGCRATMCCNGRSLRC